MDERVEEQRPAPRREWKHRRPAAARLAGAAQPVLVCLEAARVIFEASGVLHASKLATVAAPSQHHGPEHIAVDVDLDLDCSGAALTRFLDETPRFAGLMRQVKVRACNVRSFVLLLTRRVAESPSRKHTERKRQRWLTSRCAR